MKLSILNMMDITAAPDVFAPLEALAEVISLPADRQLLLDEIDRFDAYFADLRVRVDADIIARADRLRVIATCSTGTDHIDLDAVARRGIAVLSLKGDTVFLDQVTATAELTWALLLATVRRLPWAFDSVKQGCWDRDRFRGHQLSGKTLGVLGYGRLGRIVAEYGKAFRMDVIACNDTPVEPADTVEMVDFDALVRRADVLSIHIHLTDDTRKLFDRSAFQRMKPGSILLNTSRGGVIDEAAFLDALHDGPLAGAGIDVVDGEWHPEIGSHPLIRHACEHDNLVITPHIGGATLESQRMALAHTVEKLRQCLLRLG